MFADKRFATVSPRGMPQTKKLCNAPLRLEKVEPGNVEGSEDALLARLEGGKRAGEACSINDSHEPPVWACDSCGKLRCAICMQVYREAGAIHCWSCVRFLINQGCTSLCRVEELYAKKGVPLGSSAHAAASGAVTDSLTARSADDAPVAALPLGTALLEYSDSWAIVLEEYMMGEGLRNDEVTITDRNRKNLILVDHEHAKLGEMADIPDPDQFPLRLERLSVHKARAAVGKGGSSAHAAAFGAPTDSRTAGSSNDHLLAGMAPARACAVAESAFAGASLESMAAQIQAYHEEIRSRRRCELCGWILWPEFITGVCNVCRRPVVCYQCQPSWLYVCYACSDKSVAGKKLHYAC